MTPSSSYGQVPPLQLSQLTNEKPHADCSGVCSKCTLPCAVRDRFPISLETERTRVRAKESPRWRCVNGEYILESKPTVDERPSDKSLADSSSSSENPLRAEDEEKNSLQTSVSEPLDSECVAEKAQSSVNPAITTQKFYSILAKFFKRLSQDSTEARIVNPPSLRK